MEKIIHISKGTNIEITTISGKKIFIEKNNNPEEIVKQLEKYGYEVLVINEKKNSNEYSFALIYCYTEDQFVFHYNNCYFIIFYKDVPAKVEVEVENIYFKDNSNVPFYYKIISRLNKISIKNKYLINWDGNQLSILEDLEE
jgi:hypothetical protein